jgi:hypothetical protein
LRKVPFYEHGLFFDHFLPPLGLIVFTAPSISC